MRSLSTSALGQPSDTMPIFGGSGSLVAIVAREIGVGGAEVTRIQVTRRVLAKIVTGPTGSSAKGESNHVRRELARRDRAALAGFLTGGLWHGPLFD